MKIIKILILVTIMFVSFQSVAQMRPSVTILEPSVKVFDYETGKKLRKYRISEIVILETKRNRLEKEMRYQETGLVGEVIEDITYTILKHHEDTEFHYLELMDGDNYVVMRIAKYKRGDVQIKIGNELFVIRGTLILKNL